MTTGLCPHCGLVIDDWLYRYFYHHDFPTMFELDCPRCLGVIDVDVESEPVFVCTKREGDDEAD